MNRLVKGQRVRLRLAGTDDDWTRGIVIVASGGNPQSVGLMVEGVLRASDGAWVGGGFPLTIDYERETVKSLINDEYEFEVADGV